MRPPSTTGPVSTRVLDEQLPGWDDADAFDVAVEGTGPDCARTAARCIFGPAARRPVLRLRDLLVRPVGLKPAVTGGDDLFPVLVDTPSLVVAGLDDAHLDFRVLISLERGRVRCVTAVRRHNALGHAYFAVVRPFHRRLVPFLLSRAARRGWTPAVVRGHVPSAQASGRTGGMS